MDLTHQFTTLLFGSLLPVILEGHAWAGAAWIQQLLYSRVNKKLEHFKSIGNYFFYKKFEGQRV